MARLARVVISGHPHHVTQRGNGRARTFFDDGDYALYRDLLADNCRAAGVEVWAWCLMPNHVHLILVPSDTDGLRRALARVHRSYAGTIQARRKLRRARVARRHADAGRGQDGEPCSRHGGDRRDQDGAAKDHRVCDVAAAEVQTRELEGEMMLSVSNHSTRSSNPLIQFASVAPLARSEKVRFQSQK